jgi:hypothetical protein
MNARTRKCPMCAEEVPADAVFCPYCATRFGEQAPITAPPPAPAMPAVQPAPIPVPPHKVSQAGWWIAGGAGVLILCTVIGLLLWAQRQSLPLVANLLPSATSTPLPPTQTPQDTLTFTPTATHLPTKTILPSPTLDPTTGMVKGIIQWNEQPYGGVTVKLCTDWFYACRGTEYTAVSDELGVYTFSGIEPGEYQFITQAPGQSEEVRLEDYINYQGYRPILVTVVAGEVAWFQPVSVCKYDLVLHPPTFQGGSITFSWDPYPGATAYEFEVQRPDGSGEIRARDLTATSYNGSLESGTYRWVVEVSNLDCVTRTAYITVP